MDGLVTPIVVDGAWRIYSWKGTIAWCVLGTNGFAQEQNVGKGFCKLNDYGGGFSDLQSLVLGKKQGVQQSCSF